MMKALGTIRNHCGACKEENEPREDPFFIQWRPFLEVEILAAGEKVLPVVNTNEWEGCCSAAAAVMLDFSV